MNTTTAPVAPRPAATTLVFRAGSPFEVFMIKRAATQAFMAGTHVFPGGRVDTADRAVVERGLIRRTATDELATRMGLSVVDGMTHLVAACRELLEEAGVLLATGPVRAGVVERMRAALADKRGLDTLLADENVVLDGDALRYVAHWVTPVVEPRRFSARFFAVRMPPDQDATVDRHEAVEGQWLRPAQAIADHEAGTIILPPPTLTLLDMLTRRTSLDDAVAGWPTEVIPVEPQASDEDGKLVLAYPGDPRHSEARGVPGAATRCEIVDGKFILQTLQRS